MCRVSLDLRAQLIDVLFRDAEIRPWGSKQAPPGGAMLFATLTWRTSLSAPYRAAPLHD